MVSLPLSRAHATCLFLAAMLNKGDDRGRCLTLTFDQSDPRWFMRCMGQAMAPTQPRPTIQCRPLSTRKPNAINAGPSSREQRVGTLLKAAS